MTAPAVEAVAFGVDGGRRERSGRGAAVGGGVTVGFFVVVALIGSALVPYRPQALSGGVLEAPSSAHLLGTNKIGQDVLSQLVLGTRVSLLVAILSAAGTLLIGGAVGIAAGWFRGWTDAAMMRLTDVVLVLPKLPLLLLLGALTGGSVMALSLMIAAIFWPMTARILRSQVLTIRSRTYIKAAAGFGASNWHQLRRHILPDLGLLLIADVIPAISRAVVLQAGLAFLGIGDPSQPSWGAMMRDAINYPFLFQTSAWTWWLIPPVLAIVALVVGATLLGTAAEIYVSPRLTRHSV